MADGVTTLAPRRNAPLRHGRATIYAYLALGFFSYLVNIQGNVLPFLRERFGLSYGMLSLHSSAFALGVIAVGLAGGPLTRAIGRRAALQLAIGGILAGGLILSVAPAMWASIAAFGTVGLLGALIPAIVPAVLTDLHGPQREIAFAEANLVSYIFSILAPLAVGVSVWLGVAWQNAVLAGVAIGVIVIGAYARTAVPEPRPASVTTARLPAAYWPHAVALALAVAIEFSVLLWAPTFLETVVGLSKGEAASGAALFFLGMILGRLTGAWLVRFVPTARLLAGALVVTLLGFGLYWGIDDPVAALAGVFVLGLGVAQTYPLTLGFAIAAAGPASDAGSARIMLGIGIAILVAPLTLGNLADAVGLRTAYLLVPLLVAALFAAFLIGRRLERAA